MADPLYRLTPLHVGRCLLSEQHVLGDAYSDDARMEFIIYSFLADGGPGKRVLIDLGPIGLPYLNDMFRRFKFFRELPGDPDAIVQPHGNVFDWLDRLGLAPADIDHIVFTHLHADHHGLTDGKDAGGIVRFPNALIHTSRIGWQQNMDKRVNGQWNSYVDYAFADFLLKGGEAGRVRFHDNDSILPGIDTIYLGGHSVCSQAVRVQTAHGPAIVASDEVYRFDLLATGVVARLHTTPEQLLEATDRLVDLALAGATLLPCHEPLLADLHERCGDEWLQHVRAASDRAATAYLAAPRKLLSRHLAE